MVEGLQDWRLDDASVEPDPAGDRRHFGPEKAETYEVGLKSEWLNNRLVLNTAGFYNPV